MNQLVTVKIVIHFIRLYPAKRLYAIKKTLHKIDTYNNRDGDISDFDSEDF